MRLVFCVLASVLGLSPNLTVASSINIDLTLRIDRMYTPNATVYGIGMGNLFKGDLDFAEDIWGFPLPLMDHSVGDLISFRATIDNDGGDNYGSGPLGVARECELGSFDCSTSPQGSYNPSKAYADSDGFSVFQAYSPIHYMSGSTRTGETVSMGYCNDLVCGYRTDTMFGMISNQDTRYNFTVVSNNLAPVPLPSSALLLMMGLLGFRTYANKFKV